MCIKRAQPNSYFDPELEVDNEERSFFEVCKSRKKKKNEICAEDHYCCACGYGCAPFRGACSCCDHAPIMSDCHMDSRCGILKFNRKITITKKANFHEKNFFGKKDLSP